MHITCVGSILSVDRGFLVCKYPDDTENRIALADVRALIICTQGVLFTNECLARLLEQDSVILHCNNKYKPIGWSVGLDRVVRSKAFENQIKQDKDFCHDLWDVILGKKFENHLYILEEMSIENNLNRLINKHLVSEANIAKQFWQGYFEGLGCPQKREHRGAENYANQALNYGYAVMATLIHRSILIHGLLPSLGIHHKERYNSAPLVYDLMEPMRGFVEYILYKFSEDEKESYENEDFKCWTKYLSNSLRECRIDWDGYTNKLMDAVDVYVNSVTKSFISLNPDEAVVPSLNNHYWHSDKGNADNEE